MPVQLKDSYKHEHKMLQKNQHRFISFTQTVKPSCFPLVFDPVDCVGTKTEQYYRAPGHVITITSPGTNTVECIVVALHSSSI